MFPDHWLYEVRKLSCQEQPVRDAHQWVFKQELLVKFSIVSDKWRFCFSSFKRVIVSFLPGHILLLSFQRRKLLIAFFVLSECVFRLCLRFIAANLMPIGGVSFRINSLFGIFVDMGHFNKMGQITVDILKT